MVGFLYLTGYYHQLGIEETELDFDGIFVRFQSMSALLHPVFWLAMVAAFTLLLVHRQDDRKWLTRPFHPLPTIRVVATVYTLWFVKLMTETLYGRDPVMWYMWHRRESILVLLGVLALAIQYWQAARLGHRIWGKWLTRATVAQLSLFLWVTLTVLGVWAMKRDWPLAPWQSSLLVLGLGICAYHVVRDIRQRGERTNPTPQTANKPSPSELVLLGSWVILLVLLTSSFTGMVDASRLEEGCNARKTVVFQPIPEPLQANHTYWLVLHQAGNYYVRDITPDANATDYIVAESATQVAALGTAPTVRC